MDKLFVAVTLRILSVVVQIDRYWVKFMRFYVIVFLDSNNEFNRFITVEDFGFVARHVLAPLNKWAGYRLEL